MNNPNPNQGPVTPNQPIPDPADSTTDESDGYQLSQLDDSGPIIPDDVSDPFVTQGSLPQPESSQSGELNPPYSFSDSDSSYDDPNPPAPGPGPGMFGPGQPPPPGMPPLLPIFPQPPQQQPPQQPAVPSLSPIPPMPPAPVLAPAVPVAPMFPLQQLPPSPPPAPAPAPAPAPTPVPAPVAPIAPMFPQPPQQPQQPADPSLSPIPPMPPAPIPAPAVPVAPMFPLPQIPPPVPPGPGSFGGAANVPLPPDLEAIARLVQNVNLAAGSSEPRPEPSQDDMDDHLDMIQQLARRTAEELQDLFSTSTLWEFERILGNGAFGITVLLRDKTPFRRSRRVVLKRSIRPDENLQDLVTEMDALRDMLGHTHIAQIIDAISDVAIARPRAGRIAAVARRLLGVLENPPENIFKVLNYERGPALILEYLENGSLVQLQVKALDRGIQLPNRILWSWLYCMIRACVGMTYKRRGFRRGGRLELETFEAAGNQYYPLQHSDINARNLMIHDLEPRVPEHSLVPKLVMIDFGIATWAPTTYLAQLGNLHMVARVLVNLILVDVQLGGIERQVNYGGFRTRAGMIFPDNNGVDNFPNLDPALRDLLARMLNTIEANRPDLPQVFEEARRGMEKGEAAYPGNPNETDRHIRDLLQSLLHDA
ncbi:hypothetical protein F4859DRAFT_215631 [Xylaria cf. heliscus]|nr:hypothetical protein F4859DRAFT_215631 [Xylaria cf. heliscus]